MKSERPKSKRGAARNAPKRRDSSGSDKPSFKKNSTKNSGRGDDKEFGNKKFVYKKKPKKLAEKPVDDKIRLNRFLANAGIC